MTSSLLERYQAAMRADLEALLDELEPVTPAPGLLMQDPPKRLPIAERSKRWDLAIKLATQLATAIDVRPAVGSRPAPARAPSGRRRRVDYGPE